MYINYILHKNPSVTQIITKHPSIIISDVLFLYPEGNLVSTPSFPDGPSSLIWRSSPQARGDRPTLLRLQGGPGCLPSCQTRPCLPAPTSAAPCLRPQKKQLVFGLPAAEAHHQAHVARNHHLASSQQQQRTTRLFTLPGPSSSSTPPGSIVLVNRRLLSSLFRSLDLQLVPATIHH